MSDTAAASIEPFPLHYISEHLKDLRNNMPNEYTT